MILEERYKLPYRVLSRAPDADDFGKFLMKLDPYKVKKCYKRVLVAQKLARRAEDREVPGSSPTQD